MRRIAAAALCAIGLSSAPALAHMGERPFNILLLADELEIGYPPAELPVAWDAKSWLGGDYNRLWIQSEGQTLTRKRETDVDLEVFYGRLIAPFWEVRIGVQSELQTEGGARDMRGQLALGVEGLAPYLFEIEPTFYVSYEGDVSASLEASYSLRITQRLVLQPKAELNVAIQAVPDFGVGSGVNDLELGARLRYEVLREVAPYLGFEWNQKYGETADLARSARHDRRALMGVLGLRLWY